MTHHLLTAALQMSQCHIGLKTWQKYFGQLSPNDVFADRALIRCSHLPIELKEALLNNDLIEIQDSLKWQESENCHIVTYWDSNYPLLLKEISSPPILIYVKGKLDILKNIQIAVVGSRHSSPHGLITANRFSSALSHLGLTITSGLAMGIDTASHEGALLGIGQTIAVLGTGIDIIYPKKNQKLADKIIENGCIMSEFPLKTAPKPNNFPKRNRLISGLSLATLVIEAGLKSGSLITAKFALEQNREVLAIPGSIHDPHTKGCHYLLKQGAALVESIEDIFAAVPQLSFLETHRKEIHAPLKKEQIKLVNKCSTVLQYVGFHVTAIDVIIQQSGLSLAEVNYQLVQLELDGLIQKVAGGYTRLPSMS
jgi:DNA processing protein